MSRIELRVDVTGATELEGKLSTAALVCLPEPADLPERPVAVFGWPGDGYYDIRFGPRMGHMHNFAGMRQRLWDRLAAWIEGTA